jgi:hypothetical protein
VRDEEDDHGSWKREPEGKARFDGKAKDVNGVEMITVPALGPEYVLARNNDSLFHTVLTRLLPCCAQMAERRDPHGHTPGPARTTE